MTEARAIANVNHPNIAAVYDIGQDENGPFIVMEYVVGPSGQPETLDEFIRREGVLTNESAVAVVAQLCGAVQAAHDRGIIHRDIKPSNVLLTSSGDPKLLDFGIAHAAADTVGLTFSGLTVEGATLGTPDFMAPEQEENAKDADARSDVYALGGVLYFCLTGRTMRHFRESSVPEDLRPMVLVATATDPEQRLQSARELADSLRRGELPSGYDGPVEHVEEASDGECPQCGSANPDDARFCRRCGAALLLRCKACGADMPAGTQFCTRCGADANAPLPEPTPAPAKPAPPPSAAPAKPTPAPQATPAAVAQPRKKSSPGRLVGCTVAAFFGIAILAGMLLPALTQARNKAWVSSDVCNLKMLALGMHMYCNDWDEHFPPDLSQTWPYVGDGEAFVCPAADTIPPSGPEQIAAGQCDYLFLAPTAEITDVADPSREPVMATKPGLLPDGYVSVAFADGHVSVYRPENQPPEVGTFLRKAREAAR
jgi:prepilin-type processing-associated H-X9-DG protein